MVALHLQGKRQHWARMKARLWAAPPPSSSSSSPSWRTRQPDNFTLSIWRVVVIYGPIDWVHPETEDIRSPGVRSKIWSQASLSSKGWVVTLSHHMILWYWHDFVCLQMLHHQREVNRGLTRGSFSSWLASYLSTGVHQHHRSPVIVTSKRAQWWCTMCPVRKVLTRILSRMFLKLFPWLKHVCVV